jgi:Mn2+/Fe2+ NRAMP family transporter
MTTMMLMAARSDIMGRFAVRGALKLLGWIATAVMAAAVIAMLATSF